MGTTPISELIPEAVLAAELHKSRRTLQIWRKERTGPVHVKIGKDVFYSRRAIEQWLTALEKRNVSRSGRAS